jgi:hypothetical protein
MITPERVAITIMATLAPLIPIAVTDTVPVPVPIAILRAVMATEAQADTVFAHANANLSGRHSSNLIHQRVAKAISASSPAL